MVVLHRSVHTKSRTGLSQTFLAATSLARRESAFLLPSRCRTHKGKLPNRVLQRTFSARRLSASLLCSQKIQRREKTLDPSPFHRRLYSRFRFFRYGLVSSRT